MALDPLHHILDDLKQTQWREQQKFEQLVRTWSEVVGAVVAAQTQPVRLSRQGVLQVATSSAVWAQNLAFERHRILPKLNGILTQPITDIHFSTRQWHSRDAKQTGHLRRQVHPLVSTAPGAVIPRSTPPIIEDPQVAFRRWSQVVQSRSQQNPLCPTCQCPTPSEELRRWSVCSLCATRPPSDSASMPLVLGQTRIWSDAQLSESTTLTSCPVPLQNRT